MFGWYRSQIKEHGLLDATRLLGMVGWSRSKVTLANKLLPANASCPCCGWQGHRFHDYIELAYQVRNAACPRCESHSRHRAFFLWLTQEYQLRNKTGVALVFAPEQALTATWNNASRLNVYRADLSPSRGVDVLLDIQALPFASRSVDLIWCHHVLEHVENDEAAISELCRILRPTTGDLIVSVPMTLGSKTREYGFPNMKESGHWRMYGDDFVDRLAGSGLTIETVNYQPKTADQIRCAIEPEHWYICRSSNHK
jgi:SAM-dependent methyltransferase